jgi:hypothetical protein
MYRKQLSPSKSLVAVAAFALSTSGVAFADDSSMSVLTGESYAFFNNLDYSPGRFNTPRTPRTQKQDAVTISPSKARDKSEQRIMLAERPLHGTPISPFRDDKGA